MKLVVFLAQEKGAARYHNNNNFKQTVGRVGKQ